MRQGFLAFALILLLASVPAGAEEPAESLGNWDFDVYLNDKKVGKHRFHVAAAADGVTKVRSEADFDYKVLFFTAYRYEHTAAESWSGDCLAEFAANTNANGDQIQVSGQKSGTGFVVETDGEPVELPECVMTFAYWNPAFLNEPRLLNPQTGEYLVVEVEQTGKEALEVRGQTVPATRFRLRADKVDLTLWYSADDRWLALESVARGGHIIRYELS